MTKREIREFYWFAQGFLAAAIRLRDRMYKHDSQRRNKRLHFTRGASAAAMLLEGDLARKKWPHTPKTPHSRE